MQVLSSRLNSSARSNSTSRTNRKGLSLTSRTKCNSLPKPSSQFLSEYFFQSDLNINKETQLSLKFNGQQTFAEQQSLYYSRPSVSIERSMTKMPRITFHYTTQSVKMTSNIQRINQISAQNANNNYPIQSNRGRLLPSKEFMNTVVIRSIETKNLSKNRLGSSHLSQVSNSKSNLIDSRVIDREIIHQNVYQSIPKTKQNTSQTVMNSFRDQNSFNPFNTQFHYEKSCQKIPQKSSLTQRQSPFHLLLSTANKCQSKQLSVEKQLQKVSVNQTSSFKKNPQIQQFNVRGIVIEENLQESASNSRIIETTNLLKQPERNQNQQTLFSALQQISGSIQAENEDGVLMLHSNNILQNKQVNIDQNKIKTSPEKIKLVPIKQAKQNKQKEVDSVLSNIENKPPESHQIVTISGRRNMKKFREIEKRLGEIITICNNNL